MKARKPLPRISKKRRAALGDRRVFSTVRKKPRSKSERERIYGPPGYVEWVHKQPCIACDAEGHSEVAHIRTGGMGRKDNWVRTVPLCGPHVSGPMFFHYSGCHRVLHQLGRAHIEKEMGIDLDACAAATQKAWISFTDRKNGNV